MYCCSGRMGQGMQLCCRCSPILVASPVHLVLSIFLASYVMPLMVKLQLVCFAKVAGHQAVSQPFSTQPLPRRLLPAWATTACLGNHTRICTST